MVGSRQRGGVGDAVPEVEGTGEVALGLGGRAGCQRLPAGGDSGRQGSRCVAGGRPVMGDLAEPVRAAHLERGSEAGVQPRALARDELVVADLASEVVPEPSGLAPGEQRRRP